LAEEQTGGWGKNGQLREIIQTWLDFFAALIYITFDQLFKC
jgi:hypothetical protein